MKIFTQNVLVTACILMAWINFSVSSVNAQTSGWTQTSFTYDIQTPWNLPQSDRYRFSDPVHYFWIYNGDACQYQGCGTGPRSEMRWVNNYTSGKHQFEGDVYVVSGTSGTDIMQVFGGSSSSTGFMLIVYPENGGTMKHYTTTVLATGIYNKWVHVNVQHDADNNWVYVYINGILKGSFADHGNATHYFKCGVYNISGTRSESRWKNLKYWKGGPVGGVLPVTLYQDCYNGGYSGGFGAGNYTLSAMTARGIANDDISSLKVSSGYVVTLYEHDNFTGASILLTSDNSCLVGAGWNDRVSSMKVSYAGSSLTIAEEPEKTETAERNALSGSPNPSVEGKINIQYVVEEDNHVNITVNSVNGQEIKTLVNEHKPAGAFSVAWETSQAPNGIYMVKMLCGRQSKMIRVVVQD